MTRRNQQNLRSALIAPHCSAHLKVSAACPRGARARPSAGKPDGGTREIKYLKESWGEQIVQVLRQAARQGIRAGLTEADILLAIANNRRDRAQYSKESGPEHAEDRARPSDERQVRGVREVRELAPDLKPSQALWRLKKNADSQNVPEAILGPFKGTPSVAREVDAVGSLREISSKTRRSRRNPCALKTTTTTTTRASPRRQLETKRAVFRCNGQGKGKGERKKKKRPVARRRRRVACPRGSIPSARTPRRTWTWRHGGRAVSPRARGTRTRTWTTTRRAAGAGESARAATTSRRRARPCASSSRRKARKKPRTVRPEGASQKVESAQARRERGLRAAGGGGGGGGDQGGGGGGGGRLPRRRRGSC